MKDVFYETLMKDAGDHVKLLLHRFVESMQEVGIPEEQITAALANLNAKLKTD